MQYGAHFKVVVVFFKNLCSCLRIVDIPNIPGLQCVQVSAQFEKHPGGSGVEVGSFCRADVGIIIVTSSAIGPNAVDFSRKTCCRGAIRRRKPFVAVSVRLGATTDSYLQII